MSYNEHLTDVMRLKLQDPVVNNWIRKVAHTLLNSNHSENVREWALLTTTTELRESAMDFTIGNFGDEPVNPIAKALSIAAKEMVDWRTLATEIVTEVEKVANKPFTVPDGVGNPITVGDKVDNGLMPKFTIDDLYCSPTETVAIGRMFASDRAISADTRRLELIK